MTIPFFRVKIIDPVNNYFFLCGGTIEEIMTLLRLQEVKRADGISFTQKLMMYIEANHRPMNSKFYYDEWIDQIHFCVYQCGEIEGDD